MFSTDVKNVAFGGCNKKYKIIESIYCQNS